MRRILLLALVFSLNVSALNVPRTADALRTYIRENSVTEMQDVLLALPRDLQSRFTFVYSGRALIEGTPEFPVAILFGDDAKLLLAFNDRPGAAGYASLDILEFDSVTDVYRPARLLFSPSREEMAQASPLEQLNGSVYFERNPQVCSRCHGVDHHPIFETGYPEWKGFYGSNRDHIYGYEGKKERAAYLRFLQNVKASPRYQALIFPDPSLSSVTPYLDENTERLSDATSVFNFRPNLVFGALLVRTNASGIYRKMKASRHFGKYAPLIAFALQRCDFSRIDRQELSKIETELETYGRAIPNFDRLTLETSSMLSEELRINKTLAAKMLAVMGITPDHFNLSLATEAATSYGYWSGYGDTMDLIHSKIVRDLLPSEYREQAVPLKLISAQGRLLTPIDQSRTCRLLAQRTFSAEK